MIHTYVRSINPISSEVEDRGYKSKGMESDGISDNLMSFSRFRWKHKLMDHVYCSGLYCHVAQRNSYNALITHVLIYTLRRDL